MGSLHPEVDALFKACADQHTSAALRAEACTQVVSWRWANESMSFDTPFARELYGGPAPRWLADGQANPARHVHHGLDAQGRIVLERDSLGREQLHLHAPDQRQSITWSADGRIDSVCVNRYRDAHLVASHIHQGWRGQDTEYVRHDERLLRSVMRNWTEDDPPWFCQHVFTHGTDGVLDRIDLQYLDEQGQVNAGAGAGRLIYLRLPTGETLKTIEARVQSLLLQALPAALARIPRGEPIYTLLLCYTHEDLPAAWPPFLVWGRASYRTEVLGRGEDVSYYLWAPDEIRGTSDADEGWLDDPALRDACLLHGQLMQMKQSDASAMRVLKNLVPLLEDMVRQAGLPITDDFVVAHADNTGEVSPLKAMKARLPAQRWAVLKGRGLV